MTTDQPDRPHRIDVHAHFLSQAWSAEATLGFMDRFAIAVQLLSNPLPMGERTREANEAAASAVATDSNRFGLLASLPLFNVDAGLAEIGYAFDTLAADGVMLSTNYGGSYLGDPRFEPVFAELDRRRASVLVHPCVPEGFDCISCGRPGALIEFPFETARTVADLLFAGTLERYPNVRIILAHAGGALPALSSRIAQVGPLPMVPKSRPFSPAAIAGQIRALYYDTAIAGSACSLRPLLEVTDPSHIVFGTDYPPMPEGVIAENLSALEAFDGMSPAQRAAVGTNAAPLFPRVAGFVEPAQG